MEKIKHRKEKDSIRSDIESDIPSAPTMEDFNYDPGIETTSQVSSSDPLGVATFANDNQICDSMQELEISSSGLPLFIDLHLF